MKTHAIVGAICLIVGVVLGSISGAWFERRSNEKLRERADLIQIHLRLGHIAMEADRQDYGAAGERATRFFGDVARIAEQTKADDKANAALQHLLAARDEVIAGLATAQPATAQRLKQLYLELFTMGLAPD